MAEPRGRQVNWFTVFRTDQNDGWLYGEIQEGRLRQGWGAAGLALKQPNGQRVNQAQWEAAHRELPGWGNPSPMRFAILKRMLNVGPGDIVVVPKMPGPGQLTVARVSGGYRFEVAHDRDDYGHIVPVDKASVRTFDYRADDDTFLISRLFAKANCRPAVSTCTNTRYVAAALRLLEQEGNAALQPPNESPRAAVDRAFMTGATLLPDNQEVNWFTVFRTDHNDGWLFAEFQEGRLRQGWGAAELALLEPDGQRVERSQWETAHREQQGWGEPSPKRFAILSRMLNLAEGDIVVVPKMPEPGQFTVARVSGGYGFEVAHDQEDYGHIVPVDPQSMRTFDYRADDDAFLISGLFSRANHWPAVSTCTDTEHVNAALRLLEREDNLNAQPPADLSRTAVDRAFRAAATTLRDQIAKWNGARFEEAVRQAFREQGYQVKDHRHYDRRGGDVDILVAPPARHGLFQPEEIAVQVKWKQGVDANDETAVRQIVEWAKSQESTAVKYVISSASGFTENAQERAAANEVVLIGGLQTMCFLLGVPERYRSDWELDI